MVQFLVHSVWKGKYSFIIQGIVRCWLERILAMYKLNTHFYFVHFINNVQLRVNINVREYIIKPRDISCKLIFTIISK